MAESLWSQWAIKASGEWEGRQRLFDGTGRTIAIPDWLVPDEYLQWGVAVNDMMTQVSVRTTNLDQDETARFKIFRQVPRAGCQEDVVQVQSKQIFNVSLPAGDHLFNDGSYVCNIENIVNDVNSTIAGPYKIERDSAALLKATELCLLQDNYDNVALEFTRAGYRKRIRVTCVWSGDKLAYIIYFLEQWASECNDGQSLVSCASVAGVPPMPDPKVVCEDTSAVTWTTTINHTNGNSTSNTDGLSAVTNINDSSVCISLPNNSCLKVDDEQQIVQLLWEVSPGRRRILQHKYGSNKSSILATQEQKA